MNQDTLQTIRDDAARFLKSRQTPGKPFGYFSQCAHAYAPDELSALSVALELWRMLKLPLADSDKTNVLNRLQTLQHPETGLVIDPSWEGRLQPEGVHMLTKGDSFFTRSVICALQAWGSALEHPVRYLMDLPPDTLISRIKWGRGGHHPYALGDLAVLLKHNVAVAVPGAQEQQAAFLQAVQEKQDPDLGLWIHEDPSVALTPSINFTFHTLKFTYNSRNQPMPYAEQAINSCLSACRDDRFYSWENGYACNDLDLALVLYSASFETDYRRQEIQAWARERLPLILDIQKPDGGFSFYHERAMDRHCHLRVSPSKSEGDLWGTLMYLGTIRMMVSLGYPGLNAPWGISQVHFVRT